ncbi:hypothetical protein [Achromobacter aegrifaciens]
MLDTIFPSFTSMSEERAKPQEGGGTYLEAAAMVAALVCVVTRAL